MQVTEHLFRGLLMIDGELNVLPSMADNMRVSSDGLSYLFRLREDARWSDGEPLTADDFAFAWRRMRELETRTAFLLEDVDTAEALDDRTLGVTLREPRNFFPYILASPWSFPWPRHKCEARRRLAEAREPRRQRPVHARAIRRRSGGSDRQPALVRAARQRARDRDRLRLERS